MHKDRSTQRRVATRDDRPSRYRGFELYPFQADAIEAIEAGKSVIVAAPTGAGKTLIAEYCIEKALETGRRLVYTSPIKTLSNQKYRDFNEAHPGKIGIMTGDLTVNPAAPVQIMTTEIFRNTIFEDPGRLAGIEHVVFDEIHFVDDIDRGTVWEESIIFAPEGIRFVGLSATIPNIEEFAAWMEKVRKLPVETLWQLKRPVPLTHRVFSPDDGLIDPDNLRSGRYRQKKHQKSGKDSRGYGKGGKKGQGGKKGRGGRFDAPRHNILDYLEEEDLLPCLYFAFSRKECGYKAHDNAYRKLLHPKESREVLAHYDQLTEQFGVAGTEESDRMRKLVGRGIAYHHAGVLPSFKEIIETLFTTGRIKLLFATETFALGVNMPARTVVFNSMYKFDGVSFDVMRVVDYQQMAGRAGRQGIDDEGLVITCIDPRRDRAIEALRIIDGNVEPVTSKFNLGYSAILNLHERVGQRVKGGSDDKGAAVSLGIFEAFDASFKSFQTRDASWRQHRKLLEGRLEVLKRAAYIDGDHLTDKGLFASRIYGFEVQLSELFDYGFFRDVDEIDVLIVLLAIVFTPRRGDPTNVRRIKKLGDRKQFAETTIERFLRIERKILKRESRGLEWGLTPAIVAWAKGCSIDDLDRLSDVAVGDTVRYFRLTLQVIRQFRRALKGIGSESLINALDTADYLLNRDEVDAEKQLLLK